MRKNKPADFGSSSHDAKSGNRSAKEPSLDPNTQTRGASLQGERQNAKGGPAGANQGGAPRGGSRVEPSHQQRAAKQDRGKK